MNRYGEPWRAENGPLPTIRIGEVQFLFWGKKQVGDGWQPIIPSGEHIDRIAACVNACAEISDAEMAQVSTGELKLRISVKDKP